MLNVLKKVEQYKTIILLVVAGVLWGISKLGWVEVPSDVLVALLGAAGITAKIGQNRVENNVTTMATKLNDLSSKLKLVLLLLLPALLLAGCSRISMPTKYQTNVRQAEAVCAELSRRCQAGDTEACRVGCIKASQTLTYIVGGLDATDPNAL